MRANDGRNNFDVSVIVSVAKSDPAPACPVRANDRYG